MVGASIRQEEFTQDDVELAMFKAFDCFLF